MSTTSSYLYGFTHREFEPAPGLRGLADAPVRALAFHDIAAVVSRHPLQRLMPQRRNLEPHHRIVRHISETATLVPAAFGHISETEDEILDVLRGNYNEIRGEIDRLDRKCEMGVKLFWAVDDIFDFLVRTDRELRALRDRVFRGREPAMADKLQVGGLFEAVLTRERERLTSVLSSAFSEIAREITIGPARSEKTVCQMALLIDRSADFQAALRHAATLFDRNFTLEYSGPWPAYSFVRLRLQASTHTTAA